MAKTYKIIFLGNSSVGKTTLISQYLYSKMQNPAPTIGIDTFNTTLKINDKIVNLQLWDTAGQERFHSIISNYLRNSFLALVVFSIDDNKSLINVESWINDFVINNKTSGSKKEKNNIIIVCNKMDLNVNNFDDVYTQAKNIAEKYDATLIQTSALDSEGITEMIDTVNKYISYDVEHNTDNEREKPNAIILKTKKGGCC